MRDHLLVQEDCLVKTKTKEQLKEEDNLCIMTDGYTDNMNRSLYAANVVGCKSRKSYLLDLIDLSLFSHTGVLLRGKLVALHSVRFARGCAR